MPTPSYGTRQIIPGEEYPRIVAEYKSGRTARDLADEYGVSKATIQNIVCRRAGNNLKREGRSSDARPGVVGLK